MRQVVVFIRRSFFTGLAGKGGLTTTPQLLTGKGEILTERRLQTQISAGIPVAWSRPVRVIFAAWLVFALFLFGLGRLTAAGDQRGPAPKRLSALR
jgi:hypothetical protein